MAGLHLLLCNNCGFEFKGFDWSGKLKRSPSAKKRTGKERRRVPRYKVHLPASISLVDRNPLTSKASYSSPSRGHCETISKLGMALSFVGTRFDAREFARPGRLLFVTVTLPNGTIDALVTTVTHDRVGESTAKWFVGASITQISDSDRARLDGYLEKRSQADSVVHQY
jgi:hypothetical protein